MEFQPEECMQMEFPAYKREIRRSETFNFSEAQQSRFRTAILFLSDTTQICDTIYCTPEFDFERFLVYAFAS